MLRKTTSWCKKQALAGRLFLIENPITSRLWLEPAIQRLQQLPNVTSVTCHAGAYGATNSQGQIIRKGHRFMGNCQHVLARLQRKLSPEEQRLCVPLEGKETTRSQEYPPGMVTEILRGIQEEVINRFPDRFQNQHGKSATVYMTTSIEAWNEALDMANSTFQVTRYKQFVLPVSDPLFKKAWELTEWNHMERVQIAWQPITWRFPTHVPHTHRAAAMRYTDGTMEVIEEDLGKLRHPRARFTKPVQLAIFMFGQNSAEAEVTPSYKRPRADPSPGTQDPQQFQPQELHPLQAQEDDPLRLVRKDDDEITFLPELKLTAEIKLAVKRMHKNLGHPRAAELKKLLALNGVSNQAIYSAVEGMKCNSCERTKGPARPDPGGGLPDQTASQFGDRL